MSTEEMLKKGEEKKKARRRILKEFYRSSTEYFQNPQFY